MRLRAMLFAMGSIILIYSLIASKSVEYNAHAQNATDSVTLGAIATKTQQAPTALEPLTTDSPTPAETINVQSVPTLYLPPVTTNPSLYYAHLLWSKNITDGDYRSQGLCTIAADSSGSLYVADGRSQVSVFSSTGQEQRSFQITQPSCLGINKSGGLYVTTRYPFDLSLYDLSGKLIRHVYQRLNTETVSMTIAPDQTIYVIWKTLLPPINFYITRLGPDDSVIFEKMLIGSNKTTDLVHSFTVDAEGYLNVGLSGFDPKKFPTIVLSFTESGVADPGHFGFGPDVDLVAPLVLARFADNTLATFDWGGFTWWSAKGKGLAYIYADTLRNGQRPLDVLQRRSALALGPDGKSMYYAEIAANGSLNIGAISVGLISDLQSATPTASVVPTAAATQ